MKLLIDIQKETVRIVLEEKEAIFDEISFPLDHDLSQKLLPTIDILLKKHHLEPKNIEKAELLGEVKESYTTYRIAKTVEKAFNWGNLSDK